MMIRWMIAALLVLAASHGNAQLLLGVTQSASGGGVVPPNPCSGAADFSDGCAIAVFGH